MKEKTYNSGETAYVEEIEEGDIINKGVIITSKSYPKIGMRHGLFK